jgi:tetratricopeptide (TPR) repeat protein
MSKNFLYWGLIVLSLLVVQACFAAGESAAGATQARPVPVTQVTHAAVTAAAITPAAAPVTLTAASAVTLTAASPAVQPQVQRRKPTPDMYYYAGEKYYNAFKYNIAIKYYYYATKMDKNYLAAWKKLAFCYYKLNRHNYAYSAFKKVLEFNKEDQDAVDFMQYYSNLMEKAKKQKEQRTMIDPLWRAAVLPGWGQFYNNQVMKGIMISAGVIISGGLTAYSVVDENIKYDKYKNTNENHDIAFKEAEAAWTTALIYTIVTVVIYAGGAIDAAMNYDCVESKMIEAGINNEGALMLCANIRW